MLFVLWFSSTYLTCMPVRKSTSSSTTALTSADTSRPVSPFALPINFNDAASFIFRRDVKGFQEFILLQTSTLSVAQLRDQDSGITLLHLAAERNQSEIVAFLFTAQVGLSEEVKQDLVNAKDRRGYAIRYILRNIAPHSSLIRGMLFPLSHVDGLLLLLLVSLGTPKQLAIF